MDRVRKECEGRLANRRSTIRRWVRRGDVLANVRLAVALGAAAILWAVFGSPGLGGGWVFLPVVLFVLVLIYHEQVNRRRDLAGRAAAFYERGLSRLCESWHGKGSAGERYLDRDHPYALDLDIFGEGSLFELISTARTRAGEDALASWLSAPAGKAEIADRQEAVDELRPKLDLREEVALLGEDVPGGVDAESLARWGEAGTVLRSVALPIVAGILGAVGLTVLVLWLMNIASGWYLAGIIIADAALYLPLRRRVLGVFAAADRPATELDLFARILARFERESFSTPLLVGLQKDLETGGSPPSHRIRRLVRRVQLIDAGRNQFFLPIAALLNWNLILACSLERWRAGSGGMVGRWLRSVGRIEALLALSGYAYERPEDPFPEILDEGPRFLAEGITHPLLPSDRAVRNDVDLGEEPELLVVSGSNMSGKTTFLRTVGTNAVLAQAGAPVRAMSLRLSPLAVASSMRVQDDLREGSSKFYAELRRLKAVIDMTEGDTPVLFLLDELLHGTNSKDRAAGAEGLVRGLLERGATGLVTTHDLALGGIADRLAPRAANVHFEDRIENGEMTFDYKIRAGVVTRSNALELMRAVGLDV